MRILYRNGNRGEAWGIRFDYAEFEDSHVDAALADGWVMNPLDLKKPESADTNSDGKLSHEEAKAYLDSVGLSYEGLHWKAVVKLAGEHQLKGSYK